jgi:hypothetical protein
LGGNLEVEPPEPHRLRRSGDPKAFRDALRAHRLGGGGDENFDALFEEGSVITLTKRDGASSPKTFRIGFMHDSEERVKEITRRPKDDGVDVKPPKRFHGSRTSYYRPPGRFMSEVLC